MHSQFAHSFHLLVLDPRWELKHNKRMRGLCKTSLIALCCLFTKSNLRATVQSTASEKTQFFSFYPFLEKTQSPQENNFFLRPFIWQNKLPNESNNYFLYPVGRDCKRSQYNCWSALGGLWSFERQTSPFVYHNGQFFPFYFTCKGFSPNYDYAAIFPLGGRVRNFFGRDSIEWFLWPLWLKTCQEGTIYYWHPWPFVCRCCGNAHGFAFLPLGGHFYRNNYYDKRYCLWPLIYCCKTWYPEPSMQKGFLPFFAYEEDKNVKDLSIIWPIWGHRWEKEPWYEERRILWPLWVQGIGQYRRVNRWAPFHTYSENRLLGTSKEWMMWPLVKQTDIRDNKLHIHREQFFYFLLWVQTQTHEDVSVKVEKAHFWPIYSYWNNGRGHYQVQMLSLFEVFFPNNKCVQRIYNPLFSLYRLDVQGDCRKQSLLLGLINDERTPRTRHFNIRFLVNYLRSEEEQSIMLLKGLFGYKKRGNEETVSFLWKQFKSHKNSRVNRRCLKSL